MGIKYTIITGANSGIGKKALFKFAKEGHHVIMGCRDLESGEQAATETRAMYPNSKITLYKLDLSDFSSVENFAKQVQDHFPYINHLIHNAGVFNHGETKFQETKDGYELTYQVNFLSPYLLNKYILPLLEKAASQEESKAKIIYASTTNIKYFFDPKREVNLEDLKPNSRPYNSYKMYGDSKTCQLALVFMENNFSEKIQSCAVMIPAVQIDKRTRQRLKPFFRFMAFLQNFFALKQETIADCYYYLSESQMDKVMINAKKEIIHPVGYSERLKDQIANLLLDKTFPDYCMREDLKLGLKKILEEL